MAAQKDTRVVHVDFKRRVVCAMLPLTLIVPMDTLARLQEVQELTEVEMDKLVVMLVQKGMQEFEM